MAKGKNNNLALICWVNFDLNRIIKMTTIQEQIIQKFSSVAPPGMQPALNPFV